MSGSNSAASLEAAELTDLEAARLAHQIASERLLPISARHYEMFLTGRHSGKNAAAAYDRRELEAVWIALLSEAMIEVETIRDMALVKRLQGAAKEALKQRYPERTSSVQLSQAGPRTGSSASRAN